MLPRPLFNSAIPFFGMAVVGALPSPLKRLWYRMQGATIGKHVSLGMFSYIESPVIQLGDSARIAPFTFIRARTACIIGKRSCIRTLTAIDTGHFEMGDDSEIGEQVAVGGMLTPRSRLSIGHRSKIFSYSFINPTEPITIGNETCIGGGSYLFTHGTWPSMLEGYPGSFGPLTIQNHAWVGWRCFIMPNVTIGEHSIIAAQSVVTRDVPADTMAAGSPARTIKNSDHYVRPVSEAKQHSLLLAWLEEYTACLSYRGDAAQFAGNDDSASIRIGNAPRIAYVRGTVTSITPALWAILSLGGITPELRRSCESRSIAWFDIAAKECGLTDHPECTGFRQFLTRYGIRFSVITERP